MFDFSREVFVCKCSTAVSDENPDDETTRRLRFIRGGERDLPRLDPAHHTVDTLTEMRARLLRGEHWMVGELDGAIVTYTWLIAGPEFYYTYLPNCRFRLRDDTAYGYGAWTPPELRGHGHRRRAFLEELRILAGWGKRWEASVFIKQQLEGGMRSLRRVGIDVVPLWKVTYTRQRTLVGERLADDDCVTPLFERGRAR